ncbi:MAG: HD domain-containing protein [Clostridia bacterium]|nr:HD domain-containing protein [Clostridia bacterium]
MRTFDDRQIKEMMEHFARVEELYSTYASRNAQAVRRYPSSRYDHEFLRSQYSVDADKIIHSPFFNRGSDKTQVFSFFRNDDITRRSAHVQLVSRIARTIGKALRLNLDLIEAIAIGHDIGHTPFGHKGEYFLNELYHKNTGRYFNHNVHSVRVLQTLSRCNLTLQTVDGILCHCGEKVNEKYEPGTLTSYEDFESTLEECYTDERAIGRLHPSTLEGCVVRISDMIAYLGKDRQDAGRLGMEIEFEDAVIGKSNSEIISNLIVDIVANSLDKPYLSISDDVYESLVKSQRENGEKIYQSEAVAAQYDVVVKPMMSKLYDMFLADVESGNEASPIFHSHINHRIYGLGYRDRVTQAVDLSKPNDIVVDFIASMTDDYFLEAFKHLFPNDELNERVKYVDYFD